MRAITVPAAYVRPREKEPGSRERGDPRRCADEVGDDARRLVRRRPARVGDPALAAPWSLTPTKTNLREPPTPPDYANHPYAERATRPPLRATPLHEPSLQATAHANILTRHGLRERPYTTRPTRMRSARRSTPTRYSTIHMPDHGRHVA